MNRDDLGVIDGEDGFDGRQQIGLPAEDRAAFGEGTGGRENRFLIVAGQGAAMIRAAALRPVAVRQTAVNAQGGIHSADGLTGLGRVNGKS